MQGRDVREQLQGVLRTLEVLLIGINGVVGGGIFLLPGQVAQSAGAAVWAYLAASFVVVLIGLSFAGGQHHVRRTGGPLVYAEEVIGKTAGFTVRWMVCSRLQ